MLSPCLSDLAFLEHGQRTRASELRAAHSRAFDGGPRRRRLPRARLGALVIRAGARIGGFEADIQFGSPRPAVLN